MSIIAIPETVEIPAETLVAAAAELLVQADAIDEYNHDEETARSGELRSLAGDLLRSVAPSEPPSDLEVGWTHPIVVEAYARAAATDTRAALIREKQDARYTWFGNSGETS